MTHSAGPRPHLVVIGGGIAGLAAAWEAVDGPGGSEVDVTVVETTDRIGGKLASGTITGQEVDVAADAFLARRPEATTLVREIGAEAELVPVGAQGAAIWSRGRLRPMPAGLQLGVPTRLGPLVRSGLLSPAGALAAARDLTPFRPRAIRPGDDAAVGDLVRDRLGQGVVDALVDPLVGGIHASGVDDLSAQATFPPLLSAARKGGSLMRALRTPGPAPAPDGPVFWSLRHGTSALPAACGTALERQGVRLLLGSKVTQLLRSEAGWTLQLSDGTSVSADAVVIATPADEAARLLQPHAETASQLLATFTFASVTVLTYAVAPDQIAQPRTGTGFLVPRTSRISGTPALITGVTYLDRKWPHLAHPSRTLLRASVGRMGDNRQLDLDDNELAEAAFAEMAQILGITGRPADHLVTRWTGAYPQYEVGHLATVARIERAVAEVGGLAVAGSSYRGVGIPACIASGRGAARRVVDEVTSSRA